MKRLTPTVTWYPLRGPQVFHGDVADPEELRHSDLVMAADGVNSPVREHYREHFQPIVDVRPNRFVWFGTTKPFPAFTFYQARRSRPVARARLSVRPGPLHLHRRGTQGDVAQRRAGARERG